MSSTDSLYLGLTCARCGAQFSDGAWFEGCTACRDGDWASNLIPTYDLRDGMDAWERRTGRGLWRYAAFLPLRDLAHRVSLGEGSTPLVDLGTGADTGLRVRLKNEAANPTWSYKDRLCSVAISKGLELGARVVGASSTGNHGAAAAAYAARAGLDCVVFTREDVDAVTTTFMQTYGARVVRTTRRGRWTLLAHGVHALGWYPVSTYTPAPTGNPYGSDGYKTIAFEVFEELGCIPEVVIVPSSYGEGVAGIWRGFQTLHRLGLVERLPRMVAAEPAAGAPLANALEGDLERVVEVGSPSTVATSIGSTIATDVALMALRESGGMSVRITDEQILDAQRRLARTGVLLEPAGAAGMAALAAGKDAFADLASGAEVVVVGTAGGLRQIGLLEAQLPDAPLLEPTAAALEGFLSTGTEPKEQEDGQ